VRVKGRWKYLYRGIDKDGATLDFLLAEPAQHQGRQALPFCRLEAQTYSLSDRDPTEIFS
jgi:DDE domain